MGLLACGALLALVARLSHAPRTTTRRCDAWDCGFAPPNARMQYSATGFAQPIRRVFAFSLQIEERVESDAHGASRYRLEIADRVWLAIYPPLARTIEAAARRVTRLQSGRLRDYLGWTFATLLVLLWIASWSR